MSKIVTYILVFTMLVTSLIVTTPKVTEAAGFGQWVNIDKNWRFRVDKPKQGGKSDDVKYHVHVEGKVGKKKIESSEGVNGDESHDTKMNRDDVPNWVQKEIKSSKEFKKGQEAQKELEKTVKKAQRIDWKNPIETSKMIRDLIVVTGVTIALTLAEWKKLVFSY